MAEIKQKTKPKNKAGAPTQPAPVSSPLPAPVEVQNQAEPEAKPGFLAGLFQSKPEPEPVAAAPQSQAAAGGSNVSSTSSYESEEARRLLSAIPDYIGEGEGAAAAGRPVPVDAAAPLAAAGPISPEMLAMTFRGAFGFVADRVSECYRLEDDKADLAEAA